MSFPKGILRLISIWHKLPVRWRVPIVALTVMTCAAVAWGIITDLTLVAEIHDANAEHVDQYVLLQMVQDGETEEAFEESFELGDELFETDFNALDGGGANVGQGQRFTRVPRADLTGPGEWANHIPPRATGPNGTACNQCHSQLFDDGSGTTASNVHRDPLHSGVLSKFIQRNTPHLFAPGALQRLAEEMTTRLLQIKEQARVQACNQGTSTKTLTAKGIGFGSIKAIRTQQNPCVVTYDTNNVQGVSADLIIRPYQWKGNFATLRAFNRDASHNELGMQAVEIVGDGVDGDADSVVDEMTIGDQTALAVYLAAQPRPTSSIELAALGLIDPLPASEVLSIARGAIKFVAIGCANCHVPILKIDDPVFSEPSQNANYRDAVFPAGQDPVAMGFDPAFPVSFNLTEDQPDNIIYDDQGKIVYRLGSLRKDNSGRGIVELFGDLKRHNMGNGLAEGIDEAGTGASNFLTENLWGVGSTAPYMHDGRATTITEAILEHGGEALNSKTAFVNLSPQGRKDLVAFLQNLVIFKMGEIPPPEPLKLIKPMIKK